MSGNDERLIPLFLYVWKGYDEIDDDITCTCALAVVADSVIKARELSCKRIMNSGQLLISNTIVGLPFLFAQILFVLGVIALFVGNADF